MLGFLGVRGFPSDGSQFADSLDGPIAQLGKHVAQMVPKINVQAAARFHDRADGGDFGRQRSLVTCSTTPLFHPYPVKSRGWEGIRITHAHHATRSEN